MAAEPSTPNVHITTNSDTESGTSSFLPLTPPPSTAIGPGTYVSYIYSTSPSLTTSQNADLAAHQSILSAGPPYPSFPVAGGTAIVYLTFPPNPEQEDGFWHRTQTVDYIVILEGELELSLSGGDGEKRVVKKGEVVVQRAAMHRWKNLSKTEGALFVAVSVGAEGAVEGGMEFPDGKYAGAP